MDLSDYTLLPFLVIIILLQIVSGFAMYMRGVLPMFVSRKKDKNGYWCLVGVWIVGTILYLVFADWFSFVL